MMRVLRWLVRQIFRIRSRLLLVNALIVAVPLIGVGFARFYEGEMLRAVEADMIHQAQVVREAILDDPRGLRLGDRSDLLRRSAQHTTTRLRIVSSDGMVVADSAGVVGQSIRRRLEIGRSLEGRYGAATRVIAGRGITVMFSAIPIRHRGEVVGAVYASRSTAPVQAAMRRLRRSIYQVLGYALAVTAVLTLFFSTTVSRPLRRLANNARKIAAGDRTAVLSLKRRDEIGDLARALDDMTVELAGRSAEVAELAANISHELKSPLTSMRGAAELLLDGAADDRATRERFLRNISADVDRLDRLVSRLLELSRARADDEPFASLDLARVVTDATEESAGDATILLDLGERPVPVRARRGHLRAAIRNLLENAAAHRAPDTPIRVSLAVARRTAEIRISNIGEPIGEHARERMWDRFYTTRGSSGGTGLGLPIVAAVAAAHGGSAIHSDGDGSTTFTLRLPLARKS